MNGGNRTGQLYFGICIKKETAAHCEKLLHLLMPLRNFYLYRRRIYSIQYVIHDGACDSACMSACDACVCQIEGNVAG